MTVEKKREWVLMALVAIIGVFLLGKTVRFSLDSGEVALTLKQNDGGLVTLESPKKINLTQELFVRKLDFPEGRMLENAQYGKLGFSQNFFIDAVTIMRVKTAGEYQFDVRTDDGFRLQIDGAAVCAHIGNRPMQTTHCTHRLSAGEHRFSLEYFQGGGPLGLQVHYRRSGDAKAHFIGENTKDITFERAEQ